MYYDYSLIIILFFNIYILLLLFIEIYQQVYKIFRFIILLYHQLSLFFFLNF